MKILLKFFILNIFLILLSCTHKTSVDFNLESEDLVYVGDFTSGLEGPAVDRGGNLYFVNPHRNGAIGRVLAVNDSFEIFIDSLPNGSVANGIRFDNEGLMYLADYVGHNILKINTSTKEISVFASDSSMNQPNDIAIAGNNIIYASDPDWATKTGNIWRIDPEGDVQLLEENMGTTNGIEVAPGDSILYVSESVQRKIWQYKLSPSGVISNKQLLIEFPDHGLDGMRCDKKGNLYVTRYGKGVVAIVSPKGDLLHEILLKGRKPSNIAFGGKDGKTCYVTCQDRGYIEQFSALFPGRSWKLNNHQ